MSLMSPVCKDGALIERQIMPGDVLAGGENILAGGIATVGNGTWTGAAIATGIIRRTGPTGAYTDTTDTAANIIAALSGNAPNPNVVPGTTFRMLFINTVAFALTFAAGAGVVSGTGTLTVAASLVREYLWTILSTCPTQVINCNTTNTSPTVTFVLPLNALSLPFVGSNGLSAGAVANLIGATVSGTGITTGTTVIGVTQGQGGVIGVTLSGNATATSAAGGVALTFGPTVQIDSLRSSTL